MAADNEWDDIITGGHTKAFPAVGYRQTGTSGKKRRKKRNSKGTIVMAVVALLSVSIAVIFTAVFIADKVKLSQRENEFNTVQTEYNALVEENAKISADIEEKKAEINNLQGQIQAMN